MAWSEQQRKFANTNTATSLKRYVDFKSSANGLASLGAMTSSGIVVVTKFPSRIYTKRHWKIKHTTVYWDTLQQSSSLCEYPHFIARSVLHRCAWEALPEHKQQHHYRRRCWTLMKKVYIMCFDCHEIAFGTLPSRHTILGIQCIHDV